MKTITNSYIPFAAGLPSLIIIDGLLSHNKKITYNALELYASGMTNWLVTFALKRTIDRDRPYQKYSFIQPYKYYNTYSFPSGHTSAAFAVATTLSLQYKRWYVVVPAYTWAALVGYSRMHLGVHYPSDVLGGIIVGAGSSYLCYRLRKIIETNHHKKIEKKQVLN
ncbi:MAG: phosphatase PAP2 family protein [Sphingobacteriales bacterium]|nr:phosphatase PAP2 family protein [Sphingobacteriales bacterium]MBI3719808.1 phosphatase PAP2 family protein [Sphingobacteriales bacterium]